MAGLGQDIKTVFSLRSLMTGSVQFGGSAVTPWFFTDADSGFGYGFMGDRLIPSVHLETIEGQVVTINFWNTTYMDHTIHLHGLDVDMANDGVPLTSFVVPPMQTATYTFTAPHAGTYMYHCHVDTVLHIARGMIGTVIVRPADGSTSRAWDGGPAFDEEVLWQLSTFQTSWGLLQSSGGSTVRMRPDVFLLNGRESADAIADPCSRIQFGVGQRAYLRLANIGYHWARVTLGAQPFSIVASDGRPMRSEIRTSSWELGPGERYDLLLDGFPPGEMTGLVEYLDPSGSVLGTVETRIIVT